MQSVIIRRDKFINRLLPLASVNFLLCGNILQHALRHLDAFVDDGA